MPAPLASPQSLSRHIHLVVFGSMVYVGRNADAFVVDRTTDPTTGLHLSLVELRVELLPAGLVLLGPPLLLLVVWRVLRRRDAHSFS